MPHNPSNPRSPSNPVFGIFFSVSFCPAFLCGPSDLRRGTRQGPYHATGPCELPHFSTLSGFCFHFHFAQPLCTDPRASGVAHAWTLILHYEQMPCGTDDFVATGLTRSTPLLGRRTQTPTTTGKLTHSHTNTQTPTGTHATARTWLGLNEYHQLRLPSAHSQDSHLLLISITCM